MYHVIRSADGAIEMVGKVAMPGSQPMDPLDPELEAFWSGHPNARFGDADADFVRVLEDLIDTLIMKNVIRHTDLPTAAQKKLALRKGLRNRLQGSLNLFDGDQGVL